MGLFVKKFNVVVMDGSDADRIDAITGISNMITGEKHGLAACRDFDSNHPTMKVIEIRTNVKRFNQIQDVIEQIYPGLCVFNPAV